jgi:SAM-dependent methyltransferase
VTSLVAGKKVLDLGCVEHDERYMTREWWLHRHVAAAAADCVGGDIDEAGIEAMLRQGYKAIVLDINDAQGAVWDLAPFDVVVAGELIEHLPAPQALFEFAREALCPGGQLIITTPNPYALTRVRAAHLGLTWESVDHVLFAFPSGIAEMADRAGLVLSLAGTAEPAWRAGQESTRSLGAIVWSSAREWWSARRSGAPLSPEWPPPVDILIARLIRRSIMIGETGVYVVTKPG